MRPGSLTAFATGDNNSIFLMEEIVGARADSGKSVE